MMRIRNVSGEHICFCALRSYVVSITQIKLDRGTRAVPVPSVTTHLLSILLGRFEKIPFAFTNIVVIHKKYHRKIGKQTV